MSATDEDRIGYQGLVEALPDAVYMVDQSARVMFVNRAFADLMKGTRGEIEGRVFTDFIAPEDLRAVSERYRRRLAGEDFSPHFEFDILLTGGQGQVPVLCTAKGASVGGRRVSIGTVRDISERRRIEVELAQNLDIVEEQRDALTRLTAPVIRVWDGIVVMPLVGIYDEIRGARLCEDVVESLPAHGTRELILDLTGLAFHGGAVLSSLGRISRAARMLGTRCTLVGVSPRLAMTFVERGVDMSAYVIHASLADALRAIFAKVGTGPTAG